MYGSARSRVYHARPDCPHCRIARPALLRDVDGKRPCPACVRQCTACTEPSPPFLAFECGHHFCRECAPFVVREHAQRRSAELRCPCPERGRLREVSEALLGVVLEQAWSGGEEEEKEEKEEGRKRKDPLDALNPRCPHCGAVVLDFDGCLAVLCRCGGFFCGLCLEPCASSREAHEHVRTCRLNPTPGEYFASADALQAARDRRREGRGAALLREAGGGLERAALAWRLLGVGVRVSPRCVSFLRAEAQLLALAARALLASLW